MAFYSLIFQENLLSDLQKEKIAVGITDIHCEVTGAPRSSIHVVFQAYASPDAYTAGKRSNVAFIRSNIRGSRPEEVKQALLARFTELWRRECPQNGPEDILIALVETNGINVMQGGVVTSLASAPH